MIKFNPLVLTPKIKLIEKCELFDADYYLQHNQDVRDSKINPARHYLLFGGFEGRNPSSRFNSKVYLEQNPDVARSGINPLVHYLKYGILEARPIQSVDEHIKRNIKRKEIKDYKVPFNNLTTIMVEISSECNLKCKQYFNRIDGHKPGFFSDELWNSQIVPLLPNLNDIWLVGIGEPTLSRNLIRYIKQSKDFGLIVHTTSNLQLIDYDLADQLVASGLDNLSFSCDGAKNETYSSIRINGILETIEKSLHLINNAKDRHQSSTPQLILNFGAIRKNIRELPEIVEFARRHSVERIVSFHQVAYLSEQKEESLFHEQELSDEMFLLADKKAKEYGIELTMPGLFSKPFKKDPGKVNCRFPVSFLYFYHDGRVGPCCMDFPDRYILGNINEQSIEEIWNDLPMRKLRQSLNEEPSETCKFCVDHDKMDISEPRHLFRFKGSEDYIKSLRGSELLSGSGIKNPLQKYFYANRENLIHKWIHYFDIYHNHFQRYVGKECVILEIGVYSGGSLRMWKNYFGNKARIYGIDIDPECKKYEEPNIEIFIGSQSDREFLKEVKTQIPKIDILIDDGGHYMDQQIIAFEELFDNINHDGIYLCEDTHTSFWKEYGGGYKKQGTFIEFSKTLIDRLHSWHIRNEELPDSPYTNAINSLHFYDSILVVEKQKVSRPWHEKRGETSANNANIKLSMRDHLLYFKLKLLGVQIPKNLHIDTLYQQEFLIEEICGEKFNGTIWPDCGETMIGYKRMVNLEFCILNILENDIEGDLIETGVWRGGACIFMREILRINNINNKKVWVADSFQGLPKPKHEVYPEDKDDKLHTNTELVVSEEEVKNNFKKYKLLDDQVVFLKGWFKDTMPTAPIEKLSILRLDGDMYESTIDVLFYLYPKLSIGGYCIIDDWGAIQACKKAVEDYRRVFGITDEIHKIDWTGIFWKKANEISGMSREKFTSLIS